MDAIQVQQDLVRYLAYSNEVKINIKINGEECMEDFSGRRFNQEVVFLNCADIYIKLRKHCSHSSSERERV